MQREGKLKNEEGPVKNDLFSRTLWPMGACHRLPKIPARAAYTW